MNAPTKKCMSYTRLESRPAITRLHGECDDFVVAMKKDGMSMTHVQLYQNATEMQKTPNMVMGVFKK